MPTSQTLILAVAGRQAAQFGSRSSRTFEAAGGSIGRSEDCDWVLSASGVSRVHAMIRYLNGMYFIEDRSTNGMLLNDAPLIKGDPSALKDGDRLLIDTFEVEVRLQDAAGALGASGVPDPQPMAAPAAVLDPLDFGLLDPAPRAPAYPPPTAAMPLDAELIPGAIGTASADELDPLSFLGPTDTSSGLLSGATTGNASSGWNHSASTEDFFHPPMTTGQRQASVNALPENWDLTMGDFSSPPSPPPPAPAAPPPAAVMHPPYAPPPARPLRRARPRAVRRVGHERTGIRPARRREPEDRVLRLRAEPRRNANGLGDRVERRHGGRHRAPLHSRRDDWADDGSGLQDEHRADRIRNLDDPLTDVAANPAGAAPDGAVHGARAGRCA